MPCRIGSSAAVLRAVVLLVATMLHPVGADPNNPAAAFSEYAADRNWVASHLGQFVGALLIFVGLHALARSLENDRVGPLADLALLVAVAALAAAAVLQAVDGVALKVMVDRLAAAPAAEKPAAFEAALAVRHIEIGVAAFSAFLFGTAGVLFGIALAGLARRAGHHRWRRDDGGRRADSVHRLLRGGNERGDAVEPRHAGLDRRERNRHVAPRVTGCDRAPAAFRSGHDRASMAGNGKETPMHAFATFLAAAVAALAATASAVAQTYPARPVHLIVPYPAGGGTDFFARLVGGKMAEVIGQPVVVENKPGAATNLGADFVAKAAPDGYTILLGDVATYAANPSLYKKIPFDPDRDFAPISLTARFLTVLVVNPVKLKLASVAELIAAARKAPGT